MKWPSVRSFDPGSWIWAPSGSQGPRSCARLRSVIRGKLTRARTVITGNGPGIQHLKTLLEDACIQLSSVAGADMTLFPTAGHLAC